MAKKNEKIYYCMACGKEHTKSKFYVSRNKLHSNKVLPICKDAIKQYVYVNKDVVSESRLQSILRQMDLPFIDNVFKSAVENEKETVGIYFSQINSLSQYDSLTWKDSVFREVDMGATTIQADEDFFVSEEMVNRWGTQYKQEEYQFLENLYNKTKTGLAKPTPAEYDLLESYCVAKLMEFQTRDSSPKEFGQAVKVSTSIMNELNMSPTQQKDITESQESFGKMIRQIENEEPIERYDEINEQAKTMKYTAKIMIAQIARLLGKQSPYGKDFEKFLSEYGAESDSDE